MLRSRPASQRKRIKKSLGPDFLDPSHIRETRDSKCIYCHSSSQSLEELVSCSKCDFRTHPSCFKNEHYFELCISEDWICYYCSLDCSVCKKHFQSFESILLCVECKNGSHLLCVKSSKNSARASAVKGPFTCNKCTNIKSKATKEANGVHLSHSRLAKKSVKREVMCNTVTIEMNGLEDEEEEEEEKEEKVDQLILDSNTESRKNKDSMEWSIDDVADFIRESGFPEEALLFKQQEIDGRSLLLLQRTDVLTGLSMKLGPALKIFARIYQLQMTRFQALNSDTSSTESSPSAADKKQDTSNLCMKFSETDEFEKCKTVNS